MPIEKKILAGRYELQAKLGEGGAAEVHRAKDLKLSREVAVKILRARGGVNSVLRKRFEREAQAMAGLSHPGIVGVYDAGMEDDHLFLVMELVDGLPLSEHLRRGEFHLQARLELMRRVAHGVGIVHQKGIIHRDLKPGNVLLTRAGEPKVTDFGVARLATSDTALTTTGIVLGTPLYMAPEQVQGLNREATFQTDVYALGAILYELLTGQPPFPEDNVGTLFSRIINDEPESPRRLNPEVPVDVEAICLKALEKNPARRFPDAVEMAEELDRHLRGEPVKARLPTPLERVRRGVAKRRGVLIALAAGLLVASVPAVLLVQKWMEGQELARARPHMEAGRNLLASLDRLLTDEEADDDELRAMARQARREFEKALEECGRHAEAMLEIARTYRLEGDTGRAIDWCTRAVECDPRLSTAYLERGLWGLEAFVTRCLARGPDAPPSTGPAAVPAGVQRDLRRAGEESREKGHLALAEGLLLFADREYQDAVGRLEEYAETAPSDPRAWIWLGIALSLKGGEGDRTVRVLTRAIGYRPRHTTVRLMRGIALAQAGRLEEALADFDVAVERSPRYAAAHNNRGIVHKRMADRLEEEGHDEEAAAARSRAIRDFDRALILEPGMAGGYHNRGYVYFVLGDMDKAFSDFDEAIRLDPDHSEAHFRRGFILMGRGELDAAIEDLSRAIDLDPRSSVARLNRGATYQKRAERAVRAGKSEEARADLERALVDLDEAVALRSDYAVAYLGRGLVHEQLGDRRAAIADYDRAVELRPRHPDAYVARGNARTRMRDWKRAIADYEKALETGPPGWSIRAQVEKALEQARSRLGEGEE